MSKIVVLLLLVCLIEVYSHTNHHDLELLEDSYHHHMSDEIRRSDEDKLRSRRNLVRKLSTTIESFRKANFDEGCCDGFDPDILKEVEELVQHFGNAWDEIMEKYNVKPIPKFTKTLNEIIESVTKVREKISNILPDVSKGQPSSEVEIKSKDQLLDEDPDYDIGVDSTEEEYLDDGVVIPDHENAIKELQDRIKVLLQGLPPF